MPKTLADFKEELSEMLKAIPVCAQKIKTFDVSYDSAVDLYSEGATLIGERVRDLKEAGRTGNTLNQFIDDGEVLEPRKVAVARSGAYKTYQLILEQFKKADAAPNQMKLKACYAEAAKLLETLDDIAEKIPGADHRIRRQAQNG